MLKRFHWLPLAILGAAVLAAAGILYLRHRVEGRSRAVSLVLDYAQLRTLAAASGVPLEQAMRDFKAAGITGIAVTEQTLAELQTTGALEVRVVSTATGTRQDLTFQDPAVSQRARDYVS